MGNPQVVIAVADVDRAPVETLGMALQSHPAFPESVNVGFLQVIDPTHARLRVYERGAGETLACGSGACAAVVAGRIWGQLQAHVDVTVRGGQLTTEWAGEGEAVVVTGPAEKGFGGRSGGRHHTGRSGEGKR